MRHSPLRTLSLLSALVGLTVSRAAGEPANLYLAAQFAWHDREGFYLTLENDARDGKPAPLSTLKLALGVADGKSWRFLVHTPTWAMGRDYAAKAVVRPDASELWLDGQKVGESAGAFLPHKSPVTADGTVPWANGPADYAIVQRSVALAAGARQESRRCDADRQQASPLRLFGRVSSDPLVWESRATETLVIEAIFRIEPAPDLRKLAPFIDRYGQAVHADWPEKVKSDDELRADIAREDAELARMPPSADFDEFGGYKNAGWTEKATGFFRVVRRQGYWWLIAPTGNPCFYLGVNSAPAVTWEKTPVTRREFLFAWLPPREGAGAAAWGRDVWGAGDGADYVAFHTGNLIRKYGENDWMERASQQALRRLRAGGFSGGAKWGSPDGMVATPVVHAPEVPKLARHVDVFDPHVREQFRAAIEKQIGPRRTDPRILGWAFGSEFDEIVTEQEILDILHKPAHVPAKRALLDHALDRLHSGSVERLAAAWKLPAAAREALYGATPTPPPADLEALRQFYADATYRFVYETFKSVDPNHLYLGNYIVPGWWQDASDWELVGRHCDVLSYDFYGPEFTDARLAELLRKTDKPVFCGEFSFPATYGGARGFGQYGAAWAKDDAHAGELYAKWVDAAARHPLCIGGAWFQYRDQPLTGRGPGTGNRLVYGEHYAFGLVTMTDRPKWPLVRRMREVNLQAARGRLAAAEATGASRK